MRGERCFDYNLRNANILHNCAELVIIVIVGLITFICKSCADSVVPSNVLWQLTVLQREQRQRKQSQKHLGAVYGVFSRGSRECAFSFWTDADMILLFCRHLAILTVGFNPFQLFIGLILSGPNAQRTNAITKYIDYPKLKRSSSEHHWQRQAENTCAMPNPG